MADFGKLNFSVAFNPTSAFPIDARCIFTSYAAAEAAASTAQEVGSTSTVYYYGMKLMVYADGVVTWYEITTDKALKAEGGSGESSGETIDTSQFLKTSQVGSNLEIDENSKLNVTTASDFEGDNSRPITAAAVETIVGNVDALLETI